MAGLIRILSIDGGGIRGIIPGQILIHLEKILRAKTKNKEARIADYFDFIAGTSTGGILTCLYLCPDQSKKTNIPRCRYSAEEVVNFYLEHGAEIFQAPLWHRIFSLFGLIKESYRVGKLEKNLHQYFGNINLNHLIKPCLITSYNIEERYTHFFTKHDAEKSPEYNYRLKDVARATSAAPTYFKAARIKSLAKKFYPLIDGGVFANNPALCAYTEVCKTFNGYPTARDMVILSLGTGDDEKAIPYNQAKNWGKIGWAIPILKVLTSGNSETVDYQLKTIFKAVQKPNQYLRINPKVSGAMTAMDNVSPENLKALVDYGRETAKKFNSQLEKIAELLIEDTINQEKHRKVGG